MINPSKKVYVFSSPTKETVCNYARQTTDYLKDTFPNYRFVCNIKQNIKSTIFFSYDFGNIESLRTLDDSAYHIIVSKTSCALINDENIITTRLYMY